MKIFLDDIRKTPKEYDLTFRNAEDLLEWIKKNPNELVSKLSLDHDLGDGIMDGTEFVKELVELDNNIKYIQIHSDNLIGFKNMYYYIKNAHKHNLMPNLMSLSPRKFDVIDGVETSALYRVVK